MTTPITINHVKQARMCCKGARNYARAKGLDWDRFISGGYTIDDVEQMLAQDDDPMLAKLVEVARNDK